MEWKYYEYLKTLDYRYGEKTIREAIEQVLLDQNISKSIWVNKTKLAHNDYWVLNSIAKRENWNKKAIMDAHNRIVINKLKK